MNMAKAHRRWQAWRRWEDRVGKLCGDNHKGLPGQWNAHNEHAFWFNSRLLQRRLKARWNRRTVRGSRR